MSEKDILAARRSQGDLEEAKSTPVQISDPKTLSVEAQRAAQESTSARVNADGSVTYDLRSWAAIQRRDLTLSQVIATLEGTVLESPLSIQAQGL